MKNAYRDPTLGSEIILVDQNSKHNSFGKRDFFRIIWNRGEPARFGITGLEETLEKNHLVCLTPMQVPQFREWPAEFYMLLFNREFYCIHENDHEVSCEGLLFWGSSELPVIRLDEEEQPKYQTLFNVFEDELATRDSIQEEMLRMLLKRLIIKSTRIAREQLFPDQVGDKQMDLIRRFKVLVEQHYKEHHQVSEYAEMLYKSPKTLSNVFSSAGHQTPLEIIHDRIALEAKRQLLKTNKLSKEIAYDLGFEEQSHFSRFFKKETGLSPSVFREKAAA